MRSENNSDKKSKSALKVKKKKSCERSKSGLEVEKKILTIGLKLLWSLKIKINERNKTLSSSKKNFKDSSENTLEIKKKNILTIGQKDLSG